MNKNEELVVYTLQNSQMGIDTLLHLGQATNDGQFSALLQQQRGDLLQINSSAKRLLVEAGYVDRELPLMAKLASRLVLHDQIEEDPSVDHLARLLLRHHQVGMLDADKVLKKYRTADPIYKDLVETLAALEVAHAGQLSPWLHH